MPISFQEEFLIEGLKFQIHQSKSGVANNRKEIVSILTQAKQYKEDRIVVRQIERRHFSQVTFLSRNSGDFLSRVKDNELPEEEVLDQLIKILEAF